MCFKKCGAILLSIIVFINVAVFSVSESKPERSIMFSLKYGKADNEIAVYLPVIAPGESREGDLSSGPCDFVVDEDENVYISDCGDERLKKYDRKGNVIFVSQKLDSMDMIFLSEKAVFSIIGSGQDTIVKLDKTNGVIIEEQTNYGATDMKIFTGTTLGKEISGIPGFKYGKKIVAFMDKEGNIHEFDVSKKGEFSIEVKKKGKPAINYKITSERDVDKDKKLDRDKIRGFFVDENGQYYAWGLVKREKPLFIDKPTDMKYIHDVVIQRFEPDGTVTDEIRFPGGYPFGLNGIRDTVRFGKTGVFYTIDFEKDKMNVVKHTWN